MRRADQYHTRNRLRATAKCRKCRGGNRARIDITRVRRDQRFGNTIDRRCDPGEEVRDLPLQTMRIVGVELACYRGWPDYHVFECDHILPSCCAITN